MLDRNSLNIIAVEVRLTIHQLDFLRYNVDLPESPEEIMLVHLIRMFKWEQRAEDIVDRTGEYEPDLTSAIYYLVWMEKGIRGKQR